MEGGECLMKIDKSIFGKLIPIVIAGGMAVYGEIMNQKSAKEVEDLEARIAKLEEEKED